MSNLFWYSCLAILGVALAVFSVYKNRRLVGLANWLVFYLFVTGITWVGEFSVLGLFNSYAYKPGLFADPWAENLSGHLILNSTLWPGVGVLVAAYSLGYGWLCLISGLFVLTEYIFVMFGLYEQHWWRYYMTAGTLFLFLVIAKNWFRLINRKRHGFPRFVTMFFAALVIIHLPFPLLLLLGKQHYQVALADNLVLSSTIFSFSYQAAEALIAMACFFLGKWHWKLAPFVIAAAGQAVLAKMGILIILDGWNFLYLLLTYFTCLAICLLMEKYTLLPPSVWRAKG